jgi:hypothetical protein
MLVAIHRAKSPAYAGKPHKQGNADWIGQNLHGASLIWLELPARIARDQRCRKIARP